MHSCEIGVLDFKPILTCRVRTFARDPHGVGLLHAVCVKSILSDGTLTGFQYHSSIKKVFYIFFLRSSPIGVAGALGTREKGWRTSPRLRKSMSDFPLLPLLACVPSLPNMLLLCLTPIHFSGSLVPICILRCSDALGNAS